MNKKTKFSASELDNHVEALMLAACILDDYRDYELIPEREDIRNDINDWKLNLQNKKIDDVEKAISLLHQRAAFLRQKANLISEHEEARQAEIKRLKERLKELEEEDV